MGLKIVGETPERRIVVTGFYDLYETHGIPLDIILSFLWGRGALPDWDWLLQEMIRTGQPRDRAISTLEMAVQDAGYPKEFETQILLGIRYTV